MGTFRLVARGWIGKWLAAIEAESIPIARACIWDNTREIPGLFSLKSMARRTVSQYDLYFSRLGSPHSETRAPSRG